MSEQKRKLAIYWAASCGGCDIAVLGLQEKIFDLAAAFEIVFWPCVMDAKVGDVEAMPDKSIDVCLFNGAVRTSEQEFMARLMRSKARVLVAFGSCAHEGCIPGLANLATREQIFDTAYLDATSTVNPDRVVPQTRSRVDGVTLQLPEFYDTLKTLGQTVDVDYYLPGCPPESERVAEVIAAILDGKLPEAGSVIGVDKTVCDECDRKREEKKLRAFKRTWQVIPDSETCLLEQGLICCGIATRAGCGALCPEVNSPCIGCYGPNDGVEDFGARMMTALASIIDSEDPDEIDRIIHEGIPDPVGTFYRFSLAASLLRRANRPPEAPAATGRGER